MPSFRLRNSEPFLDNESPTPRVSQSSSPNIPSPYKGVNIAAADITSDPQDDTEEEVDSDVLTVEEVEEAFTSPRLAELKVLLCKNIHMPDKEFKEWLVKNADILRHAFASTLPNPALYVHEEGQVFEVNVTKAENLLIMDRVAELSLEIDWNHPQLDAIIDRVSDPSDRERYKAKHLMRKHYNRLPPVVMYRHFAKNPAVAQRSRAKFDKLVEMRKNRPHSLLHIVQQAKSRSNSASSSTANSVA